MGRRLKSQSGTCLLCGKIKLLAALIPVLGKHVCEDCDGQIERTRRWPKKIREWMASLEPEPVPAESEDAA